MLLKVSFTISKEVYRETKNVWLVGGGVICWRELISDSVSIFLLSYKLYGHIQLRMLMEHLDSAL